jgi:hypothetical protein
LRKNTGDPAEGSIREMSGFGMAAFGALAFDQIYLIGPMAQMATISEVTTA